MTMHETNVKPSATFICSFPDCQASYNRAWKLEVHLCKHTGERPYKCEYSGCGKSFCYSCTAEGCSFVGKNWMEMTNHKKVHIVRLQCDQCKKTFRDSWFLKQHQHVHSEERVSHILSFHEEQRSFICTQPGCGRSFAMKVTVLSRDAPNVRQPKKALSLFGQITHFGYLIYAMVKNIVKMHGGGKLEKPCSVFGPVFSFFSASAKNFHSMHP
uniref:General transcription factor IIIAa n=1 Tax=Sinocyclocheilus grahami TaxID=75366 RepID=A0A672PRI2_SINGR